MSFKLAKIISFLFQPLLMPIYGTIILLNAGTWMSYTIFPALRNALYLVMFTSTFLMPALTFLLLLKKKEINSLEMESRTERNIPYISTLLFYIVGWYLLNKLPLPRVFGNIIMGASLAILIAFLINLRWKISIHMMALGGTAGMLFAFATLFNFPLSTPLIMLLVIAGITGTARLILHAHIPSQVYTGFLLGFGIEWLFVYIYNLAPYYISIL